MAVDGQVEIRPMMYLALSYDHRLVDGKEAVTFLVRVKECIEQPSGCWWGRKACNRQQTHLGFIKLRPKEDFGDFTGPETGTAKEGFQFCRGFEEKSASDHH